MFGKETSKAKFYTPYVRTSFTSLCPSRDNLPKLPNSALKIEMVSLSLSSIKFYTGRLSNRCMRYYRQLDQRLG